ncbi:hypothetical protein LguiA_026745 [Lonicera macranthoides]
MLLHCLTWIPHLWGQLFGLFVLFKNGVVRHLPDDIIVNILSRLPADCVLESRRVCKKWQALTSSPKFAELHLRNVTSSTFVSITEYGDDINMFVFDEQAKTDKRVIKIWTSPDHLVLNPYKLMLIGSCNGLLLFEEFNIFSRIYILNPVTQEQRFITFTRNCPGYLCGVYFHRLTEKYKLLTVYDDRNCYCYMTNNLGDKSWIPLTSFSCRPRSRKCHMLQFSYNVPVNVHGSLHWLAKSKTTDKVDTDNCKNAILIFRTDIENFDCMPHPGTACHLGSTVVEHKRMRLLVMKEKLCLCHYHVKEMKMSIWVLEDYGKWDWVRRYKVNLDWGFKCGLFEYRDKFISERLKKVKAVCIQNGELLLYWHEKECFFWYHLEKNSVRKLKSKWIKISRYVNCHCQTIPYTKSLVSLRNI